MGIAKGRMPDLRRDMHAKTHRDGIQGVIGITGLQYDRQQECVQHSMIETDATHAFLQF